MPVNTLLTVKSSTAFLFSLIDLLCAPLDYCYTFSTFPVYTTLPKAMSRRARTLARSACAVLGEAAAKAKSRYHIISTYPTAI